jgi:hypothetical protein
MPVSWDGRDGDDLAQFMCGGIIGHMRKVLGSVRCPDHKSNGGQDLTVRVHGKSLDDLSWDIETCCPAMHGQVTAGWSRLSHS